MGCADGVALTGETLPVEGVGKGEPVPRPVQDAMSVTGIIAFTIQALIGWPRLRVVREVRTISSSCPAAPVL